MGDGYKRGFENRGACPTHLSAECKIELGWITPTVVENNLYDEGIDYAEFNKDVYKIPLGMGQYFLVESRKRIGFDQLLPGEGLLIYHIGVG
ncbi:hypothetical protein DRN85_09120, partial [Methanosarcinales archaeon]